MKITYWLCLCGLVFACNGKKTTAEGGLLSPGQIPDSLPKNKPVGQKLTGAQMDRLRTILEKTPLLPDSSLFLAPQDETDSEARIRQARIANLPTATKQIYANILSRCTPDGKKAANGEFAKGKSQNFNYVETISGRDCPLEVKRERNQAYNWVQVEKVSGLTRAMGTSDFSHRSVFNVTDGSLAKNSSITKITSISESHGAVKMENGRTTNYLRTQGARSVVVLGEGPVSASSKSQLLETTESGKTLREEIVDLKIKVTAFEFQLWYYSRHNDGSLAEESMYINGEPVVAEEFADFLKGSY